MNEQSKWWFGGAALVAVMVVVAVAVFGIRRLPELPSLYEAGNPTVTGTVAFVDDGREQCVGVLDVATSETRDVFCSEWLWIEGWGDDGNLRVESADGNRVSVVDPTTGEVLASGDFAVEPQELKGELRSESVDGRAILANVASGDRVVLIDLQGPHDYGFWDYGLTNDEQYVWASDSEGRLIVVASDGSAGPWLVADDIRDPVWRDG